MDKVREALEDLFVMVKGEVPSLLEDHHLFDKITDALASDNWLPIETAPKDKVIQLYLPDNRIGREIIVGYYDHDYVGWVACLGSVLLTQPTHWQPLPNPPKEK